MRASRYKSRWAWVTVLLWVLFFARPAAAAQYALLIAVQDYREPAWRNLQGPINDLALWQDLLFAYGVPSDHIVFLKDRAATKQGIVGAFRQLAERVQPGDIVFIAFSGHGTQIADVFNFPELGVRRGDEPDKNDEALVPADARANDPRSFLIDDEIAHLLRRFLTTKIFLVDTCWSWDMERGAECDWRDVAVPDNQPRDKGDKESLILTAATVDNTLKVHEILALPTNPPRAISVSPLTYFLWVHAMQQPGIPYGRLLFLIKKDFQRWGVPWQPGWYAPEIAVRQPFLGGGAHVDWDKKVRLTRRGQTIEVRRRDLLPDGNLRLPLGPVREGEVAEGLRVAMVIGLNEWPPDAGLPPLHGGVRDAQRLSETLQSVGYVVVLMTPDGPENLRPTPGNILTQLTHLLNMENVVSLSIYFAGHGISHNGQAYFMPMDARRDFPDLTGLSLQQIVQVIGDAHIDIPRKILAVDACKVGVDNPARGFIEALQRVGGDWLVITSCSEGETAWEAKRGEEAPRNVEEAMEPHGVFSLYLLLSRYEPTADENRDGVLSWREAFHYAEAAVRKWCVAHPGDDPIVQPRVQTPAMFGDQRAAEEPFGTIRRLPDFPPELQVRQPPLDPAGCFVVYQDVEEGTLFPFLPDGWMWGSALKRQVVAPQLVTQMMQLDMVCAKQPEGDEGTCIFWNVIWEGQDARGRQWNLTWAGIGLFSGPDDPHWWAKPGDNRGIYYNLEAPRRFQRLRFSARSPRAGTRIQFKVGVLSRDENKQPLQLGDGLAWPISTKHVALSPNWQQFTLDLNPLPVEAHVCDDSRNEEGICVTCGDKPNNLERICSLAVVCDRGQQDNQNAPVQVYLDNIYFE